MSYFSFCPHEPRRLNEADLAASKNFVFFRRRFHGRMHLSVPSTFKHVPAAGFSNTEAEPLASLANFQPSSLWFKFADRYRNLPPFLLFWSSCVREFSDIFRHVLLIPGPTSSYSLDTFLNTIFSLSLHPFPTLLVSFFLFPLFLSYFSLPQLFTTVEWQILVFLPTFVQETGRKNILVIIWSRQFGEWNNQPAVKSLLSKSDTLRFSCVFCIRCLQKDEGWEWRISGRRTERDSRARGGMENLKKFNAQRQRQILVFWMLKGQEETAGPEGKKGKENVFEWFGKTNRK